MPVLPDDQFENYLRQFRPLPPGEMPLEKRGPTWWRPRSMAAYGAIAAVVVAALLTFYPRMQPSPRSDDAAQWADGAYAGSPRPLTIQSANELLTRAPSFKAAVDALGVPSHAASFVGKQSAFDVLSKDSKL